PHPSIIFIMIIFFFTFIFYAPFYSVLFFFFNDTATTEIYTLSLHDALPICRRLARDHGAYLGSTRRWRVHLGSLPRCLTQLAKEDRKSTRLNSSHDQISYAVFCLKKKKKKKKTQQKN